MRPHRWGDAGPILIAPGQVHRRIQWCDRPGCTTGRVVDATPLRTPVGYVVEREYVPRPGACVGAEDRVGARKSQRRRA